MGTHVDGIGAVTHMLDRFSSGSKRCTALELSIGENAHSVVCDVFNGMMDP